MKLPQTPDAFNDSLAPFLNERDQNESDKLLEQIVCEFAQPLIEGIISFKLRVHPGSGIGGDERDDASDLNHDVVLRLVKRLRQIKAAADESPITNLRGYVATIAYNACDEYLRRKYPKRHSLKNKLRYILAHQEGLALWENEDKKWVCGFADWKKAATGNIARIERLREELQASLRERGSGFGNDNPADLLAAIFDWLKAPVELDDAVTVVADHLGVHDQQFHLPAREENAAKSGRSSVDPRSGLDEAIDRRISLHRLWLEIRQLPVRQRAALLLSARAAEGVSVVILLPRIGVANIREIAEALEIPAEELATLWNELPLEDSTIAHRLGMTRQQIINLRKSARERLTRRMA